MCGLAGFLRFDTPEDGPSRRSLLERMGRLLERRGPDDEQFYLDDDLAFVFRRLSIVDVDGGMQPIWNADETVFVAVNGEIYNHKALRGTLKQPHRFRTESDSEIVLHLYDEQGAAALDQLIGMYAVVIWDTRQRLLLLARDRMGVKPLYLAPTADGLLFGSELKALLVHPACPRDIAWSDLVDYGPQQKTPVSTYVRGVEHLPAGHLATVSPDEPLSVRAYWRLDDHFGRREDLDDDAAVDAYDELMSDSVRLRLMSDVPLGIFLSGGVDSALITAMAARHAVHLDCFTAVERTTWRAGDVAQARAVAATTDMRLHPVLFETEALRKSFDLATFEQQIAMMESPRFDPEWFFKLQLHAFARELNPRLKVILLGQGADEFAGGYSHRLGTEWRDWADYLYREVEPELARLDRADAAAPGRLLATLAPDFSGRGGRLGYQRKMQRLCAQLQHFNLWHEDRTSSRQGIESRVPFLDHRLVELLAGLSPERHASLFWDKAIVRRVLARWLPDYPRDHRKVAFFVTDDMSSIEVFIRAIVRNVYPDFRERYDPAPFDPARLDECYQAVCQEAADAVHQAWQVVEAMSVVVFQAFCRDPEAFYQPRDADGPRHVRRVEDDDWEAVAARFDAPAAPPPRRDWRADTRVALAPGGRVLTPLSEDEEMHEVLLYRQERVQSMMRIPDAAYWAVMMLEKMERDGQGLSVAEWSQLVDQPVESVAGMLDAMVNAGFVVQVESEPSPA